MSYGGGINSNVNGSNLLVSVKDNSVCGLCHHLRLKNQYVEITENKDEKVICQHHLQT